MAAAGFKSGASAANGGPYNAGMENDDPAVPYAGLTPDTVLNALESIGLRCDGRLLTPNRFQPRVPGRHRG